MTEDIDIEVSEFHVIIAWMKSVVMVSNEQQFCLNFFNKILAFEFEKWFNQVFNTLGETVRIEKKAEDYLLSKIAALFSLDPECVIDDTNA